MCLVRIVGYKYFDDKDMPNVDMTFKSLEDFVNYVKNTCISKKSLQIPAQNVIKTFPELYSNLSWKIAERHLGLAEMNIFYIERIENLSEPVVLFSAGTHMGKKPYVSPTMQLVFDRLKLFKTNSIVKEGAIA